MSFEIKNDSGYSSKTSLTLELKSVVANSYNSPMNMKITQTPCIKKTKKVKVTNAAIPGAPVLYYQQLRLGTNTRCSNADSVFDSPTMSTKLIRNETKDDLPFLTTRKQSSSTESASIMASDNKSLSTLHDEQLPKLLEDGANTLTLNHLAALSALQVLIRKHGRMSHMAVLDSSYTFFVNKALDGALHYKIKDKVAVVGGNPLCDPVRWRSLLSEFSGWRKKRRLGIAFLGATGTFVEYAKAQPKWVSMRFGTERALNPITNPVLLEKEGKRMIKQHKQLLDPARGNVKIEIYIPAEKRDLDLEAQLMTVYERWRQARNNSRKTQAYMTVLEPFSLPHLMIYIYTSGADGEMNGFAALRRVETGEGYHIDPYCALPDAPRGISDLLIYAALALLNRAGVKYLGLGFEPAAEMTDICGLSTFLTKMMRSSYQRTSSILPLSGKKAFHDKWHPDEQYDDGIYFVYPNGRPDIRHLLATMHLANASVRQITKKGLQDCLKRNKSNARSSKAQLTPLPSDKTSSSTDNAALQNTQATSLGG